MRSRHFRSLAPPGRAALGLFLCGLCGCPNPNAYTVPRTLTAGDTQFTVAPEGFAYDYKQQNGGTALGMTPTGLSFGFRYGVSDRFDVGGRLSSLLSPTVDGKIQLARGAVDVALDPGAQLLYVTLSLNGVTKATGATSQPRALVLDLYAPVLIGFNLSSSLTVVLSPGIGYAFATPLAQSANNSTNAAQAAGFMGRMGFGLDIRYSEQFAIHPEVTVMRVFDSAQSYIGVLGVGFNIGAMPDYSDLDAKK